MLELSECCPKPKRILLKDLPKEGCFSLRRESRRKRRLFANPEILILILCCKALGGLHK